MARKPIPFRCSSRIHSDSLVCDVVQETDAARRPEGAHFLESLHVIVQLRPKQVGVGGHGSASGGLLKRCAMLRLVLCALDHLLMWTRVPTVSIVFTIFELT